LADSLLLALAREFQVYSSEYRKFTLAPSLDSADLVVRVQVLHFHIIGSDTQTIIEEKRKKGEMPQNYDSLEQERMGRIVAANIAANVIANLISMPLGFATVIVIKDRGMLGTDLNAYSASTLSCEFELLAKNKIIWEKRTDHFFHLTNPTNEAEQISVLMRNTMLEIQDELPILSWRGNAFYQ